MKAVWEKQEGCDTPESWRAFQFWLALPVPRSFRYVAESCAVSYGTILRWAELGRWQKRAKAWDEHLAAVRSAEIERAVRDDAKAAGEKHLETVRLAMAVADRELHKLLKTSLESGGQVMLPRDLIRLVKESVHLERLVRGQATEITATECDLSKLTDAEFEEYERLIQKTRTDS